MAEETLIKKLNKKPENLQFRNSGYHRWLQRDAVGPDFGLPAVSVGKVEAIAWWSFSTGEEIFRPPSMQHLKILKLKGQKGKR